MKAALLVWGGWDGYEPEKDAKLFASFLQSQEYQTTISDTLDIYLDNATMQTMDLIVPIWSMGTMTEKHEHGLLETVKAGAGLAGWHGCMADSFRQNTEYQFMVGGQWVAHPGGIIDYTVNISQPDDPIVAGLSDFSLHSEQYYMHIDPLNEVLTTTTFTGEYTPWIDGCVMPVVWKKRWGKGRVFYSSLGQLLNTSKGERACHKSKDQPFFSPNLLRIPPPITRCRRLPAGPGTWAIAACRSLAGIIA